MIRWVGLGAGWGWGGGTRGTQAVWGWGLHCQHSLKKKSVGAGSQEAPRKSNPKPKPAAWGC